MNKTVQMIYRASVISVKWGGCKDSTCQQPPRLLPVRRAPGGGGGGGDCNHWKLQPEFLWWTIQTYCFTLPILHSCVVCCCVYIDILLEVLFTLSTTESFSCSLGLQVVPFEAEEQKIINIATVSWGERKRPSRSQCIKYLCRYQ